MNKQFLSAIKLVKIVLPCLIFWTVSAQAIDSIECGYLGHSTAATTYGSETDRDNNHATVRLSGIENCSYSYSYLSETAVDNNYATALFTASHSVLKSGDSYIIEASGSSFASASAVGPLPGGNASSSAAKAYGINTVYFSSDRPIKYSLTASSYGLGSSHEDAISFRENQNFFPFHTWYVGDEVGRTSNAEYTHEVGNEYSVTGIVQHNSPRGVLSISSTSNASAEVAGTRDSEGIGHTESALAEGARWSYRLVVTPVPEPSTFFMFLFGGLGVIAWSNKRNRLG
ncbi:MAG: PEP-CTERM sorting domain-containing protein [Moraxellaceae bacterium]|nr:MAG: PEP-CTERM sorting domain-containing protein [Moraxellaceae bacterium]